MHIFNCSVCHFYARHRFLKPMIVGGSELRWGNGRFFGDKHWMWGHVQGGHGKAVCFEEIIACSSFVTLLLISFAFFPNPTLPSSSDSFYSKRRRRPWQSLHCWQPPGKLGFLHTTLSRYLPLDSNLSFSDSNHFHFIFLLPLGIPKAKFLTSSSFPYIVQSYISKCPWDIST